MKQKNPLIIAGIMVVFLIIFFAFMFWPEKEPPCNDIGCFMDIANACGNITVIWSEDIGEISYSSEKCVFTKTIINIDESESQEMKNLLISKELTCSFKKGEFDREWLTSLVFGLDNCEGDLKEIIGQLLLFA